MQIFPKYFIFLAGLIVPKIMNIVWTGYNVGFGGGGGCGAPGRYKKISRNLLK